MCVLLCVLLDQASPSNKEVSFQRRQGSDVSFQGHQVSDLGFQHSLKGGESSLEPWTPELKAFYYLEPGQKIIILAKWNPRAPIFLSWSPGALDPKPLWDPVSRAPRIRRQVPKAPKIGHQLPKESDVSFQGSQGSDISFLGREASMSASKGTKRIGCQLPRAPSIGCQLPRAPLAPLSPLLSLLW